MKHLITAVVFLCLAACGASPLLHHLEANDVRQPVSSVPAGCRFQFTKVGLCADIDWLKLPTEEEEGSFAIRIWSASQGSPTGPWIDPDHKVSAKLWMPSMGHGSSPIQVAPAVDASGNPIPGRFEASHVYFTMPGAWEIWLQLKQGTQVIDQAKIDYTL